MPLPHKPFDKLKHRLCLLTVTLQADIALRLLCALKPFASHGRLGSIKKTPTSNWLSFRFMRPCLLHYIVNWFSEMFQGTRIILWMCPANERRRYIVTSSFVICAIHKMIPESLPKQRFLWHNQFCTRSRHGSKAYALYGRAYVGGVNVHFCETSPCRRDIFLNTPAQEPAKFTIFCQYKAPCISYGQPQTQKSINITSEWRTRLGMIPFIR